MTAGFGELLGDVYKKGGVDSRIVAAIGTAASDASSKAAAAQSAATTAAAADATAQVAAQAVLDAATYSPLIGPPTSYTYDSATGSIATIVEHYPAPIGDRTTTYGGYNTAGDPTTETDADGSHWTLGYDTSGNLISRTAA